MNQAEALVLTQRRHHLTYDDEEGVWYHYPKQYWKLISKGRQFIYYQPEERTPAGIRTGQLYFGTGFVGDVYPDRERDDHRYAEILDHQEFTSAVPFKSSSGSYVEAPKGQNVVWRAAVRSISAEVLANVVAEGGTPNPVTPRLSADDPSQLIRIYDEQYATVAPERVKAYVSLIRRPTELSKALKERANHTCQLCSGEGFIQKNGRPYTETHHISEVSRLEVGSLQSSNVIVLCPTCHRKMHYAPVELERVDVGWLIGLEGNTHRVVTTY